MLLSKRPDIEKFVAAPPADARAAVIHGKDRGQVRERAQAVAKAVAKNPDDPFDVSVLTEADLDGDVGRLESELVALSLMGGRRLVRLRLTSDKGAVEKAAGAALAAHLKGAFNPQAFFLVEAPALGKDSSLRKASEADKLAACIPCYDDEAGDIARMVRESLAKDRVSLTADALDLFVARLPKDRGVARAEIERLALYIGPGADRVAGPDDLTEFLGVEPEASLFEAASDAFGGRLKAAHAALIRAFAEGETGPMAVRAVSFHLGRLRRAGILCQSGAEPREAAKAAGVFWKDEREFLRQLRVWTLHELEAVMPDVIAADRASKSSGAPDQELCARLLLTIAAKARRMGL